MHCSLLRCYISSSSNSLSYPSLSFTNYKHTAHFNKLCFSLVNLCVCVCTCVHQSNLLAPAGELKEVEEKAFFSSPTMLLESLIKLSSKPKLSLDFSDMQTKTLLFCLNYFWWVISIIHILSSINQNFLQYPSLIQTHSLWSLPYSFQAEWSKPTSLPLSVPEKYSISPSLNALANNAMGP